MEVGRDRPFRQSEYRIKAIRTKPKPAGLHVLFQEHRQVLGYGVPEVRAEHADIVAASITRANDGLGSQLISQTEPGRERSKLVVDISVQSNVTEPGDTNGTRSVQVRKVGKPSVSLAVNRFGEVNFPTQSIVKGQLGGHAPGILTVEEPTFLPFRRRSATFRIVGIALQLGDVAQQERRQVKAASTCIAAGSGVVAEAVFAGAVIVAGETQVHGVPDVTAKFELMVAIHLGPVVNKLELLLTFRERTVASAHTQTVSEVGECAVHKEST